MSEGDTDLDLEIRCHRLELANCTRYIRNLRREITTAENRRDKVRRTLNNALRRRKNVR